MSCVYLHTNKINNKKYIGFSKHDDPQTRWGQNGTGYEKQKFYIEGVAPFGWENFNHRILIKDISISLAQTIEYLLIEKLDLIKNGYNDDPGVMYNNNKDVALQMLPNLLKIIKEEENASTKLLTSLNDIIDVKYKSRTMTYRLSYLFNLYQNDLIDTRLDCQREYVWDEDRQQNMWDTLLYGHRIPELHAISRNTGKYEIIDGKQRILTLMKILNNEIPLKRNSASDEIKSFMLNNNIANIYFKDLGEVLQYKINNTEINIAEYEGVDEQMLITLFQKLNAGKALTEFQKCIANNIIVRIKYTDQFEANDFIQKLFTDAERSKNEDEIFLVRIFSALNCGDIANIDSLVQRDLNKIIEKMDSTSLIKTKETLLSILTEFKHLSIAPEDISIINKTWYPLLFKFFNENIEKNQKRYFKEFLSYITIPAQRGQESTKRYCQERYASIQKDWNNFLLLKGV